MARSVRALMTPAVLSLQAASTVEAARALMHAHDVHALPVVDENEQVVGILTSGDLVVDLPPSLPIRRVMTRGVIEIDAAADPQKAAKTMLERRIHHLVVTDDGRLVGILSALDLLRLVPSRARPRLRTRAK